MNLKKFQMADSRHFKKFFWQELSSRLSHFSEIVLCTGKQNAIDAGHVK